MFICHSGRTRIQHGCVGRLLV